MGETKQINIKNRTYYFYNDIIDLKDFDAKFLKIDKKSHKNLDIYYMEYMKIKKIYDYDFWDGIKSKIKAINSDECDMKIKFNSDDDLPLNKLLKFNITTIIKRCVINKYGKLYPQLFSDDSLYEMV